VIRTELFVIDELAVLGLVRNLTLGKFLARRLTVGGPVNVLITGDMTRVARNTVLGFVDLSNFLVRQVTLLRVVHNISRGRVFARLLPCRLSNVVFNTLSVEINVASRALFDKLRDSRSKFSSFLNRHCSQRKTSRVTVRLGINVVLLATNVSRVARDPVAVTLEDFSLRAIIEPGQEMGRRIQSRRLGLEVSRNPTETLAEHVLFRVHVTRVARDMALVVDRHFVQLFLEHFAPGTQRSRTERKDREGDRLTGREVVLGRDAVVRIALRVLEIALE